MRGFNHFATPNYYHSVSERDPQHDAKKEEMYVQELVDSGKIIRFTNDHK